MLNQNEGVYTVCDTVLLTDTKSVSK